MLHDIAHRPWPLPARPWIMRQTWHDLLFAHWPVDATRLRQLIPSAFKIDTYENQAWLGVVPFRMSGVTPRRMPALPWISAFPELNVRTYVVVDDKPGVFFFSLDAGNPLAVAVARRFFHLPYYRARMALRRHDDCIEYFSSRTHGLAPQADFIGRYRPTGAVFQAAPGSLEHWLTERYCLYTTDRRRQAYRLEIHHRPWPLQPAEAEIQTNTMVRPYGLQMPDTAPLLHFSAHIDMVGWWLERLPAAEA